MGSSAAFSRGGERRRGFTYIYQLLEFVRCCYVLREVTDTTPPSRAARPWRKKGEASLSVPLLRAKRREEEAEVGLEATEHGYTPITQVVILLRSPDEALVVDVTRGLNGRDVINQDSLSACARR